MRLPAHAIPAAVVLALTTAAAAPARADVEVAMFDPDANLANVSRLRAAMDAFLHTADRSARFSAFTRLPDLKRYLSDRPVSLLIISLEDAARVGLKVTPLAVPVRGDATTHYKVLLVRKGTPVDDIEVIASTVSTEEIRSLAIQGRTRPTDKLRVLRVTKGIDALMGLAFERAHAAYVTPETVAELADVQPNLTANLEEIYRSPPIPNAPLVMVASSAADAAVARLAAAFLTMQSSREGRTVLRLLDYSGWRKP